MSQKIYNGASHSVTIKPINTATGNPAPITQLLSIEAECKHEHSGAIVKKWAYPTKEGFTPFHIADDYLSVDATFNPSETENLEEGAYEITTTMVYSDERYEDNQRTDIKKGLWFILKKK